MIFGIKKHILDFEPQNLNNTKTLVIIDSSQYYKQPEGPILQITLPGYDKYFVVPVNAGHVNIFNSNTLGLTDSFDIHDLIDLPDGVWNITFRVCPYEEVYKQKYYLRTSLLEKKFDSVLKELELNDCNTIDDEVFKRDIVDIFVALKAAEANAEEGNPKKASDLYNVANTLVNKYLNKVKGVC